MDAEGNGEVFGQLGGREAVAAWVVSGKSLLKYCNETGQSYWALRRWRLKYAEELGLAVGRRDGAVRANRTRTLPKVKPRFVPIEISAAEAPSAPALMIEVRLRGGRTVIVAATIEAATLSRLVGAIERAV